MMADLDVDMLLLCTHCHIIYGYASQNLERMRKQVGRHEFYCKACNELLSTCTSLRLEAVIGLTNFKHKTLTDPKKGHKNKQVSKK